MIGWYYNTMSSELRSCKYHRFLEKGKTRPLVLPKNPRSPPLGGRSWFTVSSLPSSLFQNFRNCVIALSWRSCRPSSEIQKSCYCWNHFFDRLIHLLCGASRLLVHSPLDWDYPMMLLALISITSLESACLSFVDRVCWEVVLIGLANEIQVSPNLVILQLRCRIEEKSSQVEDWSWFG